ncbi:disintegrin and metalloproteinase domain-containing protein 28 isoform X1 [Gallus gallus]|uniref:disintegrin and metalloproteinase domain-containing protein 28 isoform X1 n=1 Tax=Gallus gallus TaxID=9031 RepID=UPI000044979C|nr:disintegrin and metalloproteinase domain-containing protein 28 isoform X1 [Gallus gallus]XP_040545516.1 disintegrin and metalloproteinase domain-containing protein 28 isoform X1 [Gallus gallus]|eukprot:XP_001233496.1 disintegrin and metalloproteinase domain-containing protein 28 isoform X1 [Gallus gallus]
MNNVILIFVVLLCFLHQGSARKKLLGVEQYEIVYPRKLHTVHKRDAERSKEETKYDDTLEYGIKANGEEVILHLQKNKHLLAGDYTETVYSDDGQQITTSPQIKDHCYYEGYIQDEADSTASIRACKGLSGYFETRGQKYLIEPLGTSDRDKHAVYEFVEDNPIKTCGVVNSSWEVNASSPINSIFKSSNSPEMKAYLKAKKYLEVYVVADNTMYKKYNKDVNTVRQRVFGIVNFINTVYKAVNIYVALIGLEIWTDNDKCSLSPIAGSTLDNFSKWRNSDLLKRKRNDNAQLITGHDLEGTTIGLAFIKSICSDVYSAGIIQDHSRNEIAVGATMAHEMGHNLGMSHDTKDCMCHSRVCIMTDTVSSIIPKKFSSCSLQDFEKYMLNDMPKCLTNIPDINAIIAPSSCGNGFVEKGEECDCGTSEECTNACCDPETCKLTAGSMCAQGDCCEDCQYKRAGAVCREAKDDCDLPEMCTGYSGNCPSDRFRMNGHPCNNGEGFCYMGICPTRESQCRAAFGPQATGGAASCYRMNEKGVYYGYCRKERGSHVPCKKKDIMCGKLYCSGGWEMPSYGSLVTFESCKASFPRNGDTDLGMILNGTKCGDGMVCSNGECVYAEDVFRSSDCSAKCPGHAVCDHEMQCQCEEGWAPPNCDSSSAVTSFAVIAGVLAVLTVIVIAAVLLFRFRVFKKSSHTRRGPGATNQVFVDQEQRPREHPGLAVPTQKINDKKLLLPVPPLQENKPQLRSPVIRPKGPPPPVPCTKPAFSHTQDMFAPEKKPACLPVPKGKPPPPPKALKPPVNPRV